MSEQFVIKYLIYQNKYIAFYITYQSPITNHQSPITNHQSPITSHQSPVTSHQSPVTSHGITFIIGGYILNIETLGDLDFTYRVAKKGNILISHKGKLVTILRGPKAISFIKGINKLNFSQQQQLMARETGNFKRGNERFSKYHHRNRR